MRAGPSAVAGAHLCSRGAFTPMVSDISCILGERTLQMDTSGVPGTTDERMRLRYAGTCRLCGTELPAREPAIYERATKTVRCLSCSLPALTADDGPPAKADPAPEKAAAPPSIPASRAGSSARREYERRKAKDEERLRQKWGRLGGVAVALSDERQSTKAWATGAVGEERLGARLEGCVSPSLAVLHDRLIPGSRANIDHLVVTPGGIWVIDAKRYKGRPRLQIEGGIIRPRVDMLFVGRRNCTRLVDGVLKQMDVIRELVGDAPIKGALCFVDADWPLFGGSFTTREIHVLWPKQLTKILCQAGPSLVNVAETEALLADRLRPA